MSEELAFIGKIISLEAIPTADFILAATVVCGSGGKWRGVVKKSDFEVGSLCVVFLPDCLFDPEKHANMSFMKATHWRVKMRRFKGSPSEVVISQLSNHIFPDSTEQVMQVGLDVTSDLE